MIPGVNLPAREVIFNWFINLEIFFVILEGFYFSQAVAIIVYIVG